MTKKDKVSVLATHLTNQAASIFLEGLKERYVHMKALSSVEYAKAHEVVKNRLAALKDEHDWLVGQLEEIKKEKE